MLQRLLALSLGWVVGKVLLWGVVVSARTFPIAPTDILCKVVPLLINISYKGFSRTTLGALVASAAAFVLL
jgi:uncharacterized membrane protein YdjX (TVP38/TMEM64 family)